MTELKRLSNPNWPYSSRMIFCSNHSPHDDAKTIIDCADCRLRPLSRGEYVQHFVDVHDFQGLLEFVTRPSNEISRADLDADAARLRGLDDACGVNDD